MATSDDENLKVTEQNKKKGEYNRQYMKRKREEGGQAYKDERKIINREYSRARKARDVGFRIISNYKTRMNDAAKKWALRYNKERPKTPLSNLGIKTEAFKSYLELTWKEGMTWDNYGRLNSGPGWEVDHIRALNWIDFGDPEEVKKAMHYTNTQAMWREDNTSKGVRKVCGCRCEKCGE